ncbi:sialidase-3-like [Gouania willdenowi]|uniref:exo-alpha-sialidase n=1 Tax=Gouania willdenowi TaxID=441366 RepID=A0A8C5DC38_GOUWI|nr:sialidase-3 [Gouania willdenowi]XP_028322232.1 sialidase-3 [Gouania willdenowi]XP_028322233.1 sialidase-3 [Gouania willdenowi]
MGNRPSKSGSGEEPVKTTLFEREQSGTTYRIPALLYLRHCQTFLAFAEKRSSSADHDAKILVMRRGTLKEDGSVQWSSSQELSTASLPNHRTMNPCPVYEKNTKTLYLFFVCIWDSVTEMKQIITGKNKTRLCCVSSSDDGQTWSQSTDLTESVIGDAIHKWATFAVGPGHGVQLENGRLIIPAYAYYVPYRCCSFPVPFTVYPRALSIYSEDFGQTWRIGKMLRNKSCECEMAEIIDHEGRSHLYCNARHTGGHRCEALSENSGVYFDKPHMAPELVEPPHGCQGSVIGFPAPEFVPNDDTESKACGTSLLSPDTQTWLLFMHPTNKSSRRDMGVYLNRSPLHSSGWDRPRILHSGPSGYSDLAYNGDKDQFSCLMECGVDSAIEQIAFMSFSLNDVMQTGNKRDKRIR